MANYKKDYIRIENLKQYLIPKVEQHHPDSPRYLPYWKQLKRNCIEGVWGTESRGRRFMPGRLFFYGNFCTILDVDEEQNTREKIKPDIRDIEWERAYMLLEAEGFSGWSNDDVYTSNLLWFDYEENGIPDIKDVTPRKMKSHLSMLDNNGKLKKYIKARENIRKLHDKPMGNSLYWNPSQNIVELGCMHESVNVRMYDGSTKSVKDVEVGDQLMGIDSTPRTVQKLVRGSGLMYDIKSRYGEKYRMTDSHIHHVKKIKQLPVNKKRSKKVYYEERHNIDTNEILDINKNQLSRQYEFIIQNVDYPETEQLLHPYFIGCWLGDGFKREKAICYVEDDFEHIDALIDICNNDNKLTYSIQNRGNSGIGDKNMKIFRMIHSDMMYKNNYWSKTFRNNKYIPDNYLYCSKKQRLNLLAGMIDTDGSYERGRFRITQGEKRLDLLKQFQDLARSLGFRATIDKPSRSGVIRKDGTQCLKYNLTITGKISEIPTKAFRKKGVDTNLQGSKKNHIQIDLTTGKVEDFFGFELDGDHLFLLDDYTITHNSRGGGKSYWYSLGVCKYEICFDGHKYYTQKSITKPNKAEVCVGAGQQNKSSEFVKKIQDSMNQLALDPALGAWGKLGDDDYEPNIFYKEMAGSLKPNNKDNLWRHEYKVIEGGREAIEGTGSYIAHVTYSPQKRDGAEAAAGGRYNKLVYEEIGLLELLTRAWGSNNSTVGVEGRQFGNQIGLGTSGNMETILAAKEIFTHPKQYNVLAFNDDWEESGSIGFFLPAYMVDRDFKNEDGNTDYEGAIKKYHEIRRIKEEASNPHILAIEKMNSPLFPSDMWQSNKGKMLPTIEAEAREKELMKGRLYEKIGTPIQMFWDSKAPNGVDYKVKHNSEPFYTHKFRYERTSLSGEIMVYEFPQTIKGIVPQDMYKFIGHDPYVSDNMDEGDSLGVSYIIMNPKYITEGYNGNTIVASYIGKPEGGRKEYYQNLEKLIAFYGNPTRGLWFEANRGDECKNYYLNRKKENLLCLRPTRMQSSSVHLKRITQYGVTLGSRAGKVILIDKFSDWLLEETTLDDGTKRNIERIPCRFLIQEIQQFDIEKGNFDAVSAMLMCMVGLGEEEHLLMEEVHNKNKVNGLAFLSMNTKIFNQEDTAHRVKQYNKKWN